MFVYEKKLQDPVRIKNTNPKLASWIISQYGGPDGELGASLRYLSQRFSMPYPELKGLLTDIGTEGRKWLPSLSAQPEDPPLRELVKTDLHMAVRINGDCLQYFAKKGVPLRRSRDKGRQESAEHIGPRRLPVSGHPVEKARCAVDSLLPYGYQRLKAATEHLP